MSGAPDLADVGGLEGLDVEPIDTGSIWRFVETWGDDPIGSTPPKPDWLLMRKDEHGAEAGAMRAGKVAMFAGPGGIGKSAINCGLVLCIATGRRWLDTFEVPKPGFVLLALGEEDRDEIQRRLHWAARLLGLNERERALAASRIMAIPLEGVATALVQKDAAGNVNEAPFLVELRERLRAAGVAWRAVILDPLSRFGGVDTESSNEAATRFVQAVETLLSVPGRPAVIVAHHTNKSSAKEGRTDQTAVRGASALVDGVRWVGTLTAVHGHKYQVLFGVQKTNYTAPIRPILMTRMHGGALRIATVEEYAEVFPEEDPT